MAEAFDPFGLNDDDDNNGGVVPMSVIATDEEGDVGATTTTTSTSRRTTAAAMPSPSPSATFLPRSVSLSSSNADWTTIEPPISSPQQQPTVPTRSAAVPTTTTAAAPPPPPATTTGEEEWAVFDPFGLAPSRSSSSSAMIRKGSISPPPQVSRVNRATPSPPSTGGTGSGFGGDGGGEVGRSAAGASPFASPDIVAQPTTRTAGAAAFDSTTPASFAAFPSFGQSSPFREVSMADVTATSVGVSPTSSSMTAATPMMLPPKMVVKISVHEEVSSVALAASAAAEGTSDVTVEGTVMAQVQCSDAKKNAPFVLAAARSSPPRMAPARRGIHHPETTFSFLPDNRLSHSDGSADSSGGATAAMIVKVPKEEIGYVNVGNYLVTEQVPHMPILLERKVTIQGTLVRIAVQVRSKLTNLGSMEDFTIAVAFPEHVDGRTVRVLRGDGVWDDLKRIVKWRLDALHKGDSYMVTAQAALWRPADPETDIHFPVLLRCTATSDRVSTVGLEVRPADGHPASVTATITTSARILHRLS